MFPIPRFLLPLLTLALPAAAEVIYLPADGGALPSGRIKAIEARAALPDYRIGRGKPAAWQLAWPGGNLTLGFNNTDFVDGIDQPTATLACGDSIMVIKKGVDCDGGYNTIAIEWGADGLARIFAGERKLNQIGVLPGMARPEPGQVRVVSESNLDVIDLIVETDDNAFSRLQTAYSAGELADARHWRYLDRENDPAIALAGGAYELAAVKTAQGFDLVYISGATTNARYWKTGMLKGRLIPTGFQDYYRLEWYDATGRRLPDESFATVDSAGLMTLTFPALSASLRFAAR